MRFLSWIFLILTIVTVVLDWFARGEGGAMVLRPLGEVWKDVHPASLEQAPAMLEQPVLQALMSFPAALSFGIAFVVCKLLSALFRRPRRNYNVEPV